MNDEDKKQLRYHLKEALRILEAPKTQVEPEKKTKPKISPKKDDYIAPPKGDVNNNPQSTESGISWSYMGELVLFKVPYPLKDGFKQIIKSECKSLAKWNKELKVWALHEDDVTESLLQALRDAPVEWLKAQREEHVL